MLKHLKETYGYNNFRTVQEEIINDTLNGQNTIVVFPTSGGKSLCYQFPATFSGKTSIVVSPLLSLMEDQQLQLSKLGIKSTCLNGNTGYNSLMKRNTIISKNSVVYTTPEYFSNNLHMFISQKENIGLFAVDEAHCMSSWGHDFRSSYKSLNKIPGNFKNIPIMLLSATMTPTVTEDIFDIMGIEEAELYNLGTKRDNLSIHVREKSGHVLADIDYKPDEPTIIYTQTRKKTEELYNILKRNSIPAGYYHAGLSTEEKEHIHSQFSKDRITILVATIAFGMGINKPNIRKIINWGAPCDLETYYQEIGRAGRDCMPSKVVMFYEKSDFVTSRFILSKSHNVEHRLKLLNIFRKYIDNTETCRQMMIETYFETGDIPSDSKLSGEPCKKCDNCTYKDDPTVKREDVTGIATMIIDFISSLSCNYGISKLIKTIKGSRSSALGKQLLDNPYNGMGSSYTTQKIEKVFNSLLQKEYLKRIPYKTYNVIGIGKPLDSTFLIKNKSRDTESVLYKKLLSIRKKLANDNNIASYMIVNDKVLKNIADSTPKTIDELAVIDGINYNFIIQYGAYFLPKKRVKRGNTYKETYDLYKSGKDIKEISKIRGLSTLTVEKHLVNIWKGSKDEFNEHYRERVGLTEEIERQILKVIKKIGYEKIKPIKERLPHNISYFHINTCIAVNL
jgi:ATP-dependent DNA helicase RecQ